MRVIVVGDDPLARAGLATLLSETAGFEVLAQAAPSVAESYSPLAPDVVLWDLGWNLERAEWKEPLSDLIDFGAVVLALVPESSQAMEAWSVGVRGLLSREASPAWITSALNSVNEGLIVVDPSLVKALLPTQRGSAAYQVEDLTKRELEVLQLVAEGLSNRSIAMELEISEHTVKYHLNAIMRKLGAQSRTEAVVRATRSGLILL